MRIFLVYINALIVMLFATVAVGQQAPAEVIPTISLETNPNQVRAGESFEMIWRIEAEDVQVAEVFLDCADSFGPEYEWEQTGKSVFEKRVKHVEKEPGLKEYEIWAKVTKNDASAFAGESFQINVEQAEGDQDLEAFLSWLKAAGYSKEIIQIYAHDGANPLVREQWDKYFAMRKEEMAYRSLETMAIVFIDVYATEEQAINESLEGQTDALEAYMERMYGKAFEIKYVRERVAYTSLFDEPTLQTNAKGQEWLKFDPSKQLKYAKELAARITEEHELPRNAVMIHWAARQWQHKDQTLKIQDQTGSSPANSGAGFNGYGLGLYAHEWGHGLGLGHMFVNGPGSYTSRIWGLECIMNHSYVAYANREVGRLLSPLLRYVLEPEDGYVDQETFVQEYNEAMAGTELLERRLKESQTRSTVASKMAWSTPMRPGNDDSVICKGLRNRSYEVKNIELHPGMKPGTYTLVIGTTGSNKLPRTLILQHDGKTVASTPVAFQTRISQRTFHTITIENYLSIEIGKSQTGSSNLYGIGQLLNEKPLVVPDQ